jgi:translation initiation factor 1 (eIF-1/SUI1)
MYKHLNEATTEAAFLQELENIKLTNGTGLSEEAKQALIALYDAKLNLAEATRLKTENDKEENKLSKLMKDDTLKAASAINILAGSMAALRPETSSSNKALKAFLRTAGQLATLAGMPIIGAFLNVGASFAHTGGLVKDDGIQRFATGGLVKNDEIQRFATGGLVKDDEIQKFATGGLVKDDEIQKFATGGLVKNDEIQRFATGGPIQGQDNVPILAQAGEFVMRREAVENIGVQNLAQMNNTGTTPQSSINVNISGNVIGNESFVRDVLVPEISKAQRENLA